MKSLQMSYLSNQCVAKQHSAREDITELIRLSPHALILYPSYKPSVCDAIPANVVEHDTFVWRCGKYWTLSQTWAQSYIEFGKMRTISGCAHCASILSICLIAFFLYCPLGCQFTKRSHILEPWSHRKFAIKTTISSGVVLTLSVQGRCVDIFMSIELFGDQCQ